MRIARSLIAAAPLALALSACADAESVDEIDASEMEVAPLPDVAAADDEAEPAADAGDSAEYVGSFSRAEEGGTTSRLVFNADETYEYTAPDGTTSSGRYTRTANGRLAIEDFDGEAGYFAIRDGELVRLTSMDQPEEEIVVSGAYAREAASEPATAPLGSTNSVGDKRR